MCFRYAETNVHEVAPKIIKGVLFVGYTLLFIGAVAFTVIGVFHVSQVIINNNYIQTECQVSKAEMTGEFVQCDCVYTSQEGVESPGEDDKCRSSFPCARLWVTFKTSDGFQVSRAFLMNNLHTKETLNQQDLLKTKCSWTPCEPDPTENQDKVSRLLDKYSGRNRTFHCYYDKNLLETYLDISMDTKYIIVCLSFVPVFLVGLLLIICARPLSKLCDAPSSGCDCLQCCRRFCRRQKSDPMMDEEETSRYARRSNVLYKKRKTLRKMPIFALTSPETSLESIL